jgi:cell wall-associated NlpC family hydrolase
MNLTQQSIPYEKVKAWLMSYSDWKARLAYAQAELKHIPGLTRALHEWVNHGNGRKQEPLLRTVIHRLTPGQLVDVEQHLPKGELGSEVVKLALTRLGDPYSQPKAGRDDFTDCSYLVQWVYRQLRFNLPRTAAEQARFCVENGLIVSTADLVPGDLVFWSYERNGRFMEITHVGIYAGNGKVVDAS